MVQIPLAYVVAVVTVLAGAVGVLFKLYLQKEKEVRLLEEKLVQEAEKKVAFLLEFRRILLLKGKEGDDL